MDHKTKAISISSRIREIFPSGKYSGKAAGVYTNAANFSFGKTLITVADKTQGNLPYGMLCDLEGIDLKQVLQRGDPAEIDVNSLRAGNKYFEILFQGAQKWSPEFRMPIEKKDIPRILANAGAIENQLAQNKTKEGLARLIQAIPQILGSIPADERQFSKLERTAFDALRIGVNAIRNRDENALIGAMKSLIGLGIGLTPSGDDVLTGLFGTLFITMEGDFRSWLLHAYQKGIKQVNGLTTDVSASTLNTVGEGYYPERFCTLAGAIIRSRDTKEIDLPLREMLRWGSSSGSEIILGMLLGFYLAVERVE